MRMLGTLVAVVFSLIFIALFAQDRWLFMLFHETQRKTGVNGEYPWGRQE
jgi:hypothetical protein